MSLSLKARLYGLGALGVNQHRGLAPWPAPTWRSDAGCYSDPADPDWDAVSFGLRITSNLR